MLLINKIEKLRDKSKEIKNAEMGILKDTKNDLRDEIIY